MKVLFVCTGNTCRSPMAEALIKKEASRRGAVGHDFQSAGISAAPGGRASRHAVEAMEERGIDISRRPARQLDAHMVMSADLVLTMTEEQRKTLSADLPQYARRIRSIGEFTRTGEDVPDPYGGTAREYERAAARLERLAAMVLDKL